MSNPQSKQSLKDVLPTLAEPYPAQLVLTLESLHLMSLQKNPVLPNKSEIARYHICAYLTAERYQQQLKLPLPSLNKIPAQPKVVNKILDDFRANVLNGFKSPTNSPRKSMASPSPFTTPTKGSNNKLNLSPSKNGPSTPRVSSPLKRLQALRDEEGASAKKSKSNNALSDAASPFNPKNNPKTPTKQSTPGTPGTPSTPRYQRHITISDFISFANNFYIPSNVTPQMVECFLDQKHKFTKKNEWLLACGMIHAAYVRINHKLINYTMGAKKKLEDQLFQYQKGGLMKDNMKTWINIIEEAVKVEPWVIDLDKKFIDGTWSSLTQDNIQTLEITAKLGKGWEIVEKFGSMVSPDTMFDSNTQNTYYSTWTSKVLSELDS